ncbi:MAG: 3-dehydroquinate synthase [Candidatus Margulisiibacteriota bacterium]|jgi:3-dehydroquinate synthase
MQINVKFNKKTTSKIFINQNSVPNLGNIIKANLSTDKIVIITNPKIKKLYGKIVFDSLVKENYPVFFIEIPEGEKHKNLKTINYILDQMFELKLTRSATVLALGGGVIGDMAGFTAAIFMRGINLIQVPTTLLSMVDSSLGGKTGVNHTKGKNLIGSFYQPQITFIDPQFLLSLPQKEIRSGLAEIVKYAFIMDLPLYHYLSKNQKLIYKNKKYSQQLKVWLKLIKASVKDKTNVVQKDECEQGLRAILNFGHTIGHAIEVAFNYTGYTHGEAVAIGIKASFLIAAKMNLITTEYFNNANELLKNLGFNLTLKTCELEKIMQHLFSDKKIKANKLRFVLPCGNSNVEIRNDVPLELIREVLTLL